MILFLNSSILIFIFFWCSSDLHPCLILSDVIEMATRQETTPIPNLPGYTFGEKLGAGSYGRNFVIILHVDWIYVFIGTVYKAKLISVDELCFFNFF